MIFENYYNTRSEAEKKKIQEAVKSKCKPNYSKLKLLIDLDYNIPNVPIEFVNEVIAKDLKKGDSQESKKDL